MHCVRQLLIHFLYIDGMYARALCICIYMCIYICVCICLCLCVNINNQYNINNIHISYMTKSICFVNILAEMRMRPCFIISVYVYITYFPI